MKKLAATAALLAALYAVWREWAIASSNEEDRREALLNDSICHGSWQE